MSRQTIFISHITEEAELAAILQQHISRDFGGAVEVFVSSDKASIKAGADWLKSINSALTNTCIELILCSEASIKRPWINFEAGAGWIRNIPIVPVCHTGFRPAQLPMPLHVMQAVEAGEENGVDRLYDLIAEKLEMTPPEADFGRITSDVLAFEKSHASRLKEMLKADAGKQKWTAESSEEKRLVGSWQGTGADIEVPGFPPFEAKLTYEIEMKLQRKSGKVCGEFHAFVKERNRRDKAIIELIHISGDYFSFGYWLASASASHYGIMMMHMLPMGDEMKGFFLTKKVFESRIGLGFIAFTKK